MAVLRVQNVEPAPRDTRGDAQDVAIDRGNGLPERDGENRSRRIVADARQGTESVVRPRKLPAVLLRDDFRRLLKIPRAAVVPQPLPELHQPVGLRRRERRDVRKRRHEPLEVRQHRRHARLLQHDLGHPRPIGRDLLAPREHTAVFVVPAQQRRAEPG